MDQQKMGTYLKELRKEKGITQEQLADKFFVSRRTVSRWETGSNMPEIEIMIELAEFYEVDLKDLLRGERKEDNMDQNVKETAMAVAEYSNEDKKRMTRNFNLIFIAATVCFIGYLATLFLAPAGVRFCAGSIPRHLARRAHLRYTPHQRCHGQVRRCKEGMA